MKNTSAYLNKDHNIFKNIWFNFIAVPVIFIAMALISYFVLEKEITDWGSTDTLIAEWVIIGVAAFSSQMALNWKYNKEIQHKSLHYLYILISINISVFLGFVIKTVIELASDNDGWWLTTIVYPAISFAILFAVRYLAWTLISLTHHSKVNRDNSHKSLVEENLLLKMEVEKLREINESLSDELSTNNIEAPAIERDEELDPSDSSVTVEEINNFDITEEIEFDHEEENEVVVEETNELVLEEPTNEIEEVEEAEELTEDEVEETDPEVTAKQREVEEQLRMAQMIVTSPTGYNTAENKKYSEMAEEAESEEQQVEEQVEEVVEETVEEPTNKSLNYDKYQQQFVFLKEKLSESEISEADVKEVNKEILYLFRELRNQIESDVKELEIGVDAFGLALMSLNSLTTGKQSREDVKDQLATILKKLLNKISTEEKELIKPITMQGLSQLYLMGSHISMLIEKFKKNNKTEDQATRNR